jgi:YD repeat-containing protein
MQPLAGLATSNQAKEQALIHDTKNGPRKLTGAKAMAGLAVVLALLVPTEVLAQQRTVYGPDGKVRERITTDSQGSRTIYDASGRVTGRTSTDSQGTTTIYDASGRRTGSVTGPKPQMSK